MYDNDGFGLLELVIAIAVMAIIAAFALPNVLDWRANAELRAVSEEISKTMRLAKSRAVKDKQTVVVDFDPDRDGLWDHYLAFVDTGDGHGGTPDWRDDPGEPIVHRRQLPKNIHIELIDPVTGDPAESYIPQGTVRDDRFLSIAVGKHNHDVEEKGVAGGLFPVNFQQSKISFKAMATPGWWETLYDGVGLAYYIINTKILPSTILFYPDGECLTPIIIQVVNVKGEKYQIEITAYGISKATKMG